MTGVPGRLHVQPDGRLTGPAVITINEPFPCVNGSWGSKAMNGVVMHTMVGNLYPGTVARFNNPAAQVSAHFGIGLTGDIHQFGPIGKGWIAWAQAAGNGGWYSIEHADDGDPDRPLTDAQIAASAQIFECLSAFAGFPLQITDSPDGRGYGTHSMGGAPWGGHTCPDLPPRHVRSAQRADIVALARRIRDEGAWADYVTPGGESLTRIAGAAGAAEVLRRTLAAGLPAGLRAYLDAGNLGAPVPAGITLRVLRKEGG